MLSRETGMAAECCQARTVDRHRAEGHANSKSMQRTRQLRSIARRHDEDTLANPHDARTMDESLLPVRYAFRTLRDPSPAEHDLTDPGRDSPRGTGDIVRQEDPFSVIAFDRQRLPFLPIQTAIL
jgi:hypothetical protein